MPPILFPKSGNGLAFLTHPIPTRLFFQDLALLLALNRGPGAFTLIPGWGWYLLFVTPHGTPSSLQLLFCCPFALTGWISWSQGHQILQVSCIHPGNSKDLLLNLTILRLNPVVATFFLILEADRTDKSNFTLLTSYNPAKVKWKLLSHVWLFATPWTIQDQEYL